MKLYNVNGNHVSASSPADAVRRAVDQGYIPADFKGGAKLCDDYADAGRDLKLTKRGEKAATKPAKKSPTKAPARTVRNTRTPSGAR